MPKETFFNLSNEKQEKVMRSAIKEFLNNGFEKSNIGTIAKNAEAAKGSMYQYFENKKELFLFSIEWAAKLLMDKYGKSLDVGTDKNVNLFDHFYYSSKQMWSQLNDERDLVIFIQDVFLGKYKNIPTESMDYMLKASDEYVLKLIRSGKENGHIRKDMDDKLLALFMTGVSLKFKEYMLNRAREGGEDMLDESFEKVDSEVKAMLELMKNGMAPKD
ncbi:TetR/AcrR family transcriptional regulator [Clostridium oryzae]|uniref:TetR/AcrR family transcriptional regulator n=1 Tax=Clostridium oryzae TaxID=1450648 RepID=UPI0009A48B46|nr:TetR/AcrR family transcriptional regulator [Clostridium oryzae]